MAKVILGVTISLDGFAEDSNGSVGALYPDLDTLRNTEVIREAIQNTGAVVMEWKEYEDKGVILKLEPGHRIQYSHFNPLSGKPGLPENHHTVTVGLLSNEAETTVSPSQDNNETEQAREYSEKNWNMMLASLKKILEK